jgi:predicted PurR-regulated permease PerM
MLTTPRNDQERLSLILSYAGLLIMGVLAWRVVSPFLEPLLWAAIFTIVLIPVRARLARRMSAPRAALLTVVLAALLVSVPASLVVVALLKQSSQAAMALQEALRQGVPPALQDAWNQLSTRVPLPSQDQVVSELTGSLDQVATWIATRAGRIVAGGIQFSLNLSIMLFALYFMLKDTESLTARLVRLLPFDASRREMLLRQARDLVLASVTASFAVAIAQGTLGGIAFAITGIPSPVFWGCIMAFLSLLPLIGAAAVWLPAGLWLILSGHLPQGLLLLALGAGVISTVDNLIRPAVLHGRSPMNVVLLFVGVLGGIAAFGFIGTIIGPIILATALSLLEVFTDPGTTPPPATSGESPGNLTQA